MNRVIGEYGDIKRGELLIVLAGIHGNETAGINALEQLFGFFEDLNIPFNGKVIGLAGNIKGLETDTRYLHKDLNRQWYASKIKKLHILPYGMLNTQEDREQKALFTIIEQVLLEKGDVSKIYMVDLHTTSAKGGCFTITNNIPRSQKLAIQIPVPTINKMTHILKGTTIEYFENLEVPAIAFEAGQHKEEQSVDRMKVAILQMLANMNIIQAKYLEYFKEEMEEIKAFNQGLPNAVEVFYHHAIEEEDMFEMKEGYTNFKPVKHGEILAKDKKGYIQATQNGLILMPLYQKKGSDGFFLVKEI